MPFKMDADVVVFLSTVVFILLGALPRLRQTSVPIPVAAEFDELAEFSLTAAQQALFARYDREMNKLGFYPTCTYRWKNLGHNLTRSYVCPGDTARCVIMLVEVAVNVGTKRNVAHAAVIEFDTYFSDGSALFTSNMKQRSLLTKPSTVVSQRSASDDPAVLKRLHDTGVARVVSRNAAVPLTPPAAAKDIFALVAKEHQTLGEHRVQAGEYHMTPDGTFYRMTDKVLWRGVRNFLSPFGARFSPWRLLAALLAAVSMPTLQMPLLLQYAASHGFLTRSAAPMVTLLCALATGAFIGVVLEHNLFVWTFLLVTGSMWAFHLPPHLSGLWSGYIAHYIHQWIQRRRLVLLPEATAQSKPVGVLQA
jgi:hypothetical protein